MENKNNWKRGYSHEGEKEHGCSDNEEKRED
jgi:hypothetical protein